MCGWGNKDNKKRKDLVAWDKVCKAKKEGGLGLRGMSKVNTASMARMGRKILSEPDSLWAAVLKGKYPQNSSLLECKATSNSSYTWRSVLRGQELLKKGTNQLRKWIVGDGKTKKFWKDLWIGDQPLLACALGTIMDSQIWDYTDGRGSWN